MIDQYIEQAEQDLETLERSVARIEKALDVERQRYERTIGALGALRAIKAQGYEINKAVKDEAKGEETVDGDAGRV